MGRRRIYFSFFLSEGSYKPTRTAEVILVIRRTPLTLALNEIHLIQIVCLQFLLPFKSTFVQVLEDVQAEHNAESPGNVPSRAEPVLSVVKTVLGF